MRLQAELLSETDLLLRLPGALNATTPYVLSALQQGLLAAFSAHLSDTIPAYQTLLLSFQPHHSVPPKQRLAQVLAEAQAILQRPINIPEQPQTLVLPVYYGPEAGLDFNWVCLQTGLKAHELIALHSSQAYQVFAIGFSPGFAFLGQLPAPLQLPRRGTPRARVPAGSVAMANEQTAVYPSASPGGWHLLGRCPTQLFNPEHQPSSPFSIGTQVRFKPISRAQFFALGGKL